MLENLLFLGSQIKGILQGPTGHSSSSTSTGENVCIIVPDFGKYEELVKVIFIYLFICGHR